MNLKSRIELTGYGTSEGVTKGWDTRGRGRKEDDSSGGEAYHGTFSRYANSIMKKGILPKKGTAYATQSRENALRYAEEAVRALGYQGNLSEDEILKLRAALVVLDKSKTGASGGEGANLESTSGIPPEAIKRIEIYRMKDLQNPELSGVKPLKIINRDVKGQAAGGQTDSSSLIGRKYQVVDTKYGHVISEHDTPEEAEQAARARPWSKVVSGPRPENSQKLRDMARQRAVQTNPDID